jgi:1-acyl-sn-glycerol-3-phosphate acyltransferase
MECGVPVIPITIVGTHYTMPKARFSIRPGMVKVIFHPPIDAKDFGSRECLMEKVRAAIESGLPEEYRQPASVPAEGREAQGGTAYA